ncbi:MAG: SHOCT domain-containing protein [Kofleriaceae bacterium]
MQDVDIAYEQSFEIHPTVVGRSKDKVTGIALAVGGVLMIAAGLDAANDPYSTASPEAGYALGAGLLAGGAGLLVYSYAALPNGPKPEVSRGTNRWVATHTVEAEGCVAPTVAQTAAPAAVIINNQPTQPATDRLRTLDQLKASGTITEAEYKRKRAEIIDGM